MTGLVFSFKDLAVFMSTFIAALIGLFFLKSSTGNGSSTRVLGLFLLAQASTLVVCIILYGQYAIRFEAPVTKALLVIEDVLILAEGFLLYWYTKTLLFKGFSWGRRIYAHLAMMLLILGFAYSRLNLNYVGELFDFSVTTGGEAQILLGYIALQFTRCIYAGLCFINIMRYQRLLEDKYSNTDKLDLSWLKLLISGYLVARIGWSLIPVWFVAGYYSGHELENLCFIIPPYAFTFDIIWLITLSALLYFALQYSPRFEGLNERTDFSTHEKNSIKEEHARRVEEYMREHKPYLAADLKLDELAGKVSLPPKTLSILLNVHYKKNFCEFINHHRIQEATSILSDPRSKDKAVLDIAMDVGFHSKSAFNRSFKKETGITPLEYRQGVTGAAPMHDS